jgi:hypothetical protein
MEDTVAEKKPRTAGDGDGDGCNGEPSGTAESGGGGGLVERLPEALLVEVLGRLDLDDACSSAASCRSLHAAANAALSALTALDLSVSFTLPSPSHRPPNGFLSLHSSTNPSSGVSLRFGRSSGRPPQDFAPSNAILGRILAGNGAVRSLTVNCSLLDDSAASVIARGSLRELSLLKCSFSMSFFVALGGACCNLRCGSSALSCSCLSLCTRIYFFRVIEKSKHALTRIWIQVVEAGDGSCSRHSIFSLFWIRYLPSAYLYGMCLLGGERLDLSGTNMIFFLT